MERYLQIGKENLRFNIPLHLGLSILLLLVSPLVLGTENLQEPDTAKVLEMYIALIGILMLAPVFLPEQNRDLRDLVYSKYVSPATVYIVRILQSVVFLSVLLGAYLWMLMANHCEMDVYHYFGGILAEMIFFGGLGICSYALFDHLVAAYMVPMVYYVIAIGSGAKYLNVFYPFSMAYGSYEEKLYLAAGGIILIAAGVVIRCRK